jgi:hypothetical protein
LFLDVSVEEPDSDSAIGFQKGRQGAAETMTGQPAFIAGALETPMGPSLLRDLD